MKLKNEIKRVCTVHANVNFNYHYISEEEIYNLNSLASKHDVYVRIINIMEPLLKYDDMISSSLDVDSFPYNRILNFNVISKGIHYCGEKLKYEQQELWDDSVKDFMEELSI